MAGKKDHLIYIPKTITGQDEVVGSLAHIGRRCPEDRQCAI